MARTATIIGLIHGEPGAYGISFPDLPGCTSGGATLDEVVHRCREALSLHLDAMEEDGVDVAAFRTLDVLKADPALAEDFSDAVAVTAIPIDPPGRSVRLNITLDEALVERIDRRARELGESRSGFLAHAARARLAV